MEANIPKLEIGIKPEKVFAAKDAEVVKEVASIAFEALLKVTAILFSLSFDKKS